MIPQPRDEDGAAETGTPATATAATLPATAEAISLPDLVRRLGRRCVVLVGMPGAGKSSVGRRLAKRLGLNFVDADEEIERAACMSIPEIFARRGEAEFREGEKRVVARLLQAGPCVLATGGGAFMNAETRAAVAAGGVSVWLRADLHTLLRRVKKRTDRPLLAQGDPAQKLATLLRQRGDTYALADVIVDSRDVMHETVVDEVVAAVHRHLTAFPEGRPPMPAEPAPAPLPYGEVTRSTVHVDVAGRPYDIYIGPGLLAEAGTHITALRKGARVAIVTDENVVAAGHLKTVEDALDAAGIEHTAIVVAPGEKTKCWAGLQQVVEGLIAARIERRDLVLALGGGVVGDLAGFSASVLRRGVDVVQAPTTLLSQVDSSVGGKTGINSPQGKNLVGAFHQPVLVLADTAALDTLPPREVRAGYAEVVKYGLLGDKALFDTLERDWRGVLAGGPERITAVAASCMAKAAIVARDEKETGDRALLNLGHTFGHALEAGAGYSDRLLHGEGVAIGMALAFAFSAKLGLCPGQDVTRVIRHLEATGLPTRISDVPGDLPDTDGLMTLIAQDKKVSRGALTFILVRGIGEALVAKDVDPEAVRAFLAEMR
ncbi:3-dehydroquinate synthase [Xanthobacter nonsaccharivorans]|uniref:3-dehydroquinate synthase n=1 Tax=Xanthobacter nonsaccharivorans TaxID=3119912 RepID=UPI00372D1691